VVRSLSEDEQLLTIQNSFNRRGTKAIQNVRKNLMVDFRDSSETSMALRFFSKTTLSKALPVFPALLSMAYEAIKGEENPITLPFGEALVLISASADVHDDVIDQSFTKGKKPTVLGKFNTATAILTGDILLTLGFKRLAEASEHLPKEQATLVMNSVSEGVSKICAAEAIEVKLHKKGFSINPLEFLEVINFKAVVPEVSMRMGAIIAQGNKKQIDAMSEFGRIYGVNSIIFEELADLLNPDEFFSRLKNECPPLPMIYALQNPALKQELECMLNKKITMQNYEGITDKILQSIETNKLVELLHGNAEIGLRQLTVEGFHQNIGRELEDILKVPLRFVEA